MSSMLSPTEVHQVRQLLIGRASPAPGSGSSLQRDAAERLRRSLDDSGVRLAGTNDARSGGLTDREKEVLALIAEGGFNAEIAKKLFVSPETIKSHVKNILAKLNAKTRAQAVAIAIRQDLL